MVGGGGGRDTLERGQTGALFFFSTHTQGAEVEERRHVDALRPFSQVATEEEIKELIS